MSDYSSFDVILNKDRMYMIIGQHERNDNFRQYFDLESVQRKKDRDIINKNILNKRHGKEEMIRMESKRINESAVCAVSGDDEIREAKNNCSWPKKRVIQEIKNVSQAAINLLIYLFFKNFYSSGQKIS